MGNLLQVEPDHMIPAEFYQMHLYKLHGASDDGKQSSFVTM